MQKEDVKVKEKDIHASQKEGAHGYGGKYGVMKERQDKASQILHYWIVCNSIIKIIITQIYLSITITLHLVYYHCLMSTCST